MEAGRTAEFSLRQERGAAEVRVDDSARSHSFALQIEAGPSGAAGASAGRWGQPWLIARCCRGEPASMAELTTVTLGPLRAATPAGSVRVTAFAACVEAERLRRTDYSPKRALVPRDAAAIETARSRYQLAIREQGVAATDGCGVRRCARWSCPVLEVGMGNYAVGREQARAALSAACNDGLLERGTGRQDRSHGGRVPG